MLKKVCSSCVPKNPMCCPNTNISKCIQDPQALESLKCRHYIEVQTGILGIPNF